VTPSGKGRERETHHPIISTHHKEERKKGERLLCGGETGEKENQVSALVTPCGEERKKKVRDRAGRKKKNGDRSRSSFSSRRKATKGKNWSRLLQGGKKCTLLPLLPRGGGKKEGKSRPEKNRGEGGNRYYSLRRTGGEGGRAFSITSGKKKDGGARAQSSSSLTICKKKRKKEGEDSGQFASSILEGKRRKFIPTYISSKRGGKKKKKRRRNR